MIDLVVTCAPAGDVLALDLWDGGGPPALPGVATINVEPARWWLFGVGVEAGAASIEARGAMTPIGGGLVRLTIAGSGWRDLLCVSGCFDAEHPAFGIDAVASTVIDHVPVRIVVTGAERCDVYCAASYAAGLEALWRTVIGRLIG